MQKFETELLPLSPPCSLLNKPPCFIALSRIFRALCEWFSSCLCRASSLFSLYLIHGSERTPPPSLPKPPRTPQSSHLWHIMTPEDFTWSLFSFTCFFNPFPNIFLELFPRATAPKSNNHFSPKIKFIFLCCKFHVK